jgi:hypothetical protein
MTVDAHARPKIFRISSATTLTERRYNAFLLGDTPFLHHPKNHHFR